MLKELINKILDDVGLESLISEDEDHNMEEEFHKNSDAVMKGKNKKHP